MVPVYTAGSVHTAGMGAIVFSARFLDGDEKGAESRTVSFRKTALESRPDFLRNLAGLSPERDCSTTVGQCCYSVSVTFPFWKKTSPEKKIASQGKLDALHGTSGLFYTAVLDVELETPINKTGKKLLVLDTIWICDASKLTSSVVIECTGMLWDEGRKTFDSVKYDT